MRIQRILVGAALLVLCAAVAYADVRISSVITEEVIETGNAEIAGDVQLTVKEQASVGDPTSGMDTITISYGGLPITTDQISSTGTWACTIQDIDYEAGIVTLSCPAGAAPETSYFRLMGVRVQITGFSGDSVFAELGTLYNAIWAGMDNTKIIRSIGPGLVPSTKPTKAVYMANGDAITATGKWKVTEGFASAWKTEVQAIPGNTNGVEITLRLTGLEEDVEIEVGVGSGTSGSLGVVLDPADGILTADDNELVISFSATDLEEIETLELTFVLEDYPDTLSIRDYKACVTLSPNQDGLDGDEPFVWGDDAVYPKFEESCLPADGIAVFTIMTNTTTLLIPYVTSELGYDTGLAIANTTMDPWATSVGGASEQNGAITITFYPNDGGAAVVYASSTDSLKGKGMTSAGVLKAGSTWTVLASELLKAKGRTAAFAGYAIVVTDFTNAHGASYVSNFEGFTSGTPVLVVPNPLVVKREVTDGENLNN